MTPASRPGATEAVQELCTLLSVVVHSESQELLQPRVYWNMPTGFILIHDRRPVPSHKMQPHLGDGQHFEGEGLDKLVQS